nr:TPA: Insulin-like receptor [Drosophila ananassae]DBA35951.1 TPA: Insulin-like receptor [Drosophila ananassae]DBA35952.1 TPA: Insulin-like receptor [Drosophila ananassae]DBA35953.1 TPA: Insulin-like receptor [Drosophila ananassae]
MFNMKRQTKSKLKLQKIQEIYLKSEAPTTTTTGGGEGGATNEVLATATTTTRGVAAAGEATRTLSNICVLCRQRMSSGTCCYRQAVEEEAVDSPPTSSSRESSFRAQSSGYCSKLLAVVQLKFEPFLKRMAFFIGTFHKRRRREQRQQQQQHTRFLNFTKFLLLLQALAAAATTRLTSCRNNNNNNNNNNNKNNNQQQLASNHATSQLQSRRQQKHQFCNNYNNHMVMMRFAALAFICELLLMNVVAAMVYEQTQRLQHQQLQLPGPPDDLSDRLEVLRDKIRLERAATAASQPNQPMRLSRDEYPCKSMDIRNTADSVNYLANCTKIEGFLLISLIDAPQIITGTFPLLTEVTEFIIVYRVWGLESLAQLFPNLSVIRGNALFDGYSLMVHSNPNLKYVGLTKLRSITNGGVRIEKNANLCYANTIDWLHIMADNATAWDVAVVNGDLSSCEACPVKSRSGGSDDTGISCKQYPGKKSYCWNSNSCQTICPERCRDNCIDENTCCSKSCLAGCVRDSNGNESCIRCRHVSVNNTCVDSCPPNYFRYEQRCVTAEMCLKMGTKFENAELPLVPFQGVCSTRCPLGYELKNKTCVKCINSCEKECPATLIDSLVRAREFHGCTVINGGKDMPLTISIKREGDSHVMEALEYGFSAVHTIKGSLKVHLTYGLTSLRFFQSLREITGETLQDDLFALYVLENNDLEEIWAPNQTVFIRNGGVFFHFNRRLCVATINTLLPMLASKPPFFNKSDVATDSNGNRGTCGTSPLQARVVRVNAKAASVWVNKDMISEGEKENSTATIVFKDPRAFIGFQFLHALDPHGNITKSSDQPCDDTWTVSAPTKDGQYIFDNLRPYTNYAFYVRTMAISSETTNGQSDIIRFRTDPSQPSQVRNVEAVSNSDTTIDITWNPPSFPYGEMSHYEVVIKLINDTNENLTRNYCKDPITKYTDDDPKPKPALPEKVLDTDNGKCDCENKRKTGGAQEYDDRKIHVGIEFENALQNFVYVRKTVPSDKKGSNGTAKGSASDMAALESNAIGGNVRRKREIDLELESEMMDIHSSFLLRHVRSTRKSGLKFFPTDTKKAHNETSKMSANKKFYEIFVGKVPANQTFFTFLQLHHFTQYEIYVYACRKEIQDKNDSEPLCSHANEIYWKTKKKDDADTVTDLNVELGNANNTRPAVKVFWKPPADPNGQIISYDLEYTLLGEGQEQTKCISASDYNNLTEGYELKLTEGEYSFRVRANTFAGYGMYTKLAYQKVPSPQSFVKHLIWILCITVVLVATALVLALRSLRAKKRPNELHINTEVNPFYASMQYVPDSWEVSRELILQLAPLGQGSFGMVYEGILKSFADGVDRECAIKTVNEHATDRERTNFLSEASVMKEFDTNHVVRLLGVCSRGQPALVVMELMKKGDLKSYLRAHRPEERDEAMMTYLQRIGVTGNVQPPTYGRIYRMAMEIADGMAYLAAKKFVHRDLAARNCMVADDLTVKIGDFGMTRDVYETDYYRKGSKGLLPVRWMAPESLRDGVYSSASDVFSFGVVLWEMATLAAQPYQGLSNEQVLRFVIDGGVMERPENCPDLLHRLMERCWRHRSSARPSFLDIIGYLEGHCPETDFKEVSFYHSPAGQSHREKEQKERSQMDALATVPIDQDQQDGDQQEDATTPLRVGDFQDFKSNMEHNSSLDQPAESPIAMVNDNSTHSPFSLNSRFISSSTPDGQTVMPTAFHNLPASQGDDAAPYVLPDADALGEERGYEIYDPSPVYNDLPTSRSGSTGGGGGKLSGEQNLLPKKYRQPVVVMSSSVPDDVIGGSSLQPSTASAASSNASSHTGRYPSLKRVVADTFRNKANMFNRHLFNHKRTGSNASHKSNASNAPSTSSNSNLTSYPVAMGNLGTIESGGSGSAGSYTGTPRFYTPMATPVGGGLAISDNPNYKLLDESMGSEQATVLTTSSPNPNYEMMHPTEAMISDNPNYVAMNEPPVQMAGVTISHNPNYQPMQAPLHNRQTSSDEDNEDEDEEEEEDDEDEDVHVEHIKMERMPLSRPTSQRTNYSRTPGSRSRSSSQTRRSPTNPNSGSGGGGGASANNIRKENWLRQQSTARPPPPNGFIGREA